jgi:hypothetical protein
VQKYPPLNEQTLQNPICSAMSLEGYFFSFHDVTEMFIDTGWKLWFVVFTASQLGSIYGSWQFLWRVLAPRVILNKRNHISIYTAPDIKVVI